MISLTISLEKKHHISHYLYMQFMEPLGTADSSVAAVEIDLWKAVETGLGDVFV